MSDTKDTQDTANTTLGLVADAKSSEGRIGRRTPKQKFPTAIAAEVVPADDRDAEFQSAVSTAIVKSGEGAPPDSKAFRFIQRASLAAEGDLAFQARLLVQTTLPHRKPKNDEIYIRKNGNASLIIQSGTDEQGNKIGIPYGATARLLFAFITREAVRRQSAELVLGDTLTEFCREVGINSQHGGAAKMVREQLRRMLSCSIAFVSTTTLAGGQQGYEERLNLPIATFVKLWFGFKRGHHDDLSLFGPSVVHLNTDFFEAIVHNPIPLNLSVLKLLKQSPLAVDIYSWGRYRCFSAKERTVISWFQLASQFGSEYKNTRDFKRHFIKEMKKVLVAAPEVKLRVVQRGLEVTPSRDLSQLTSAPSVIKTPGKRRTLPAKDIQPVPVDAVDEPRPPQTAPVSPGERADESSAEKWGRLLRK